MPPVSDPMRGSEGVTQGQAGRWRPRFCASPLPASSRGSEFKNRFSKYFKQKNSVFPEAPAFFCKMFPRLLTGAFEINE